MKRCARLLAAIVFCCNISPVYAATKNIQTATVTAVKPDGTLVLSTGANAALANIREPDESWLAAHALQKEITFTSTGDDRYGRSLIMSNLQEKMLQDGAAMMYATQGKIPQEWHAAEAAAKTAKRGIWSKDGFVIAAADAVQHMGEFRVVVGTITRIYESKSATYVNFGEDWRTDFSIAIPGKARRSFKSTLKKLGPGSRIEVRGAIYEENGPMIRLLRPDNLEFN